MSNYLKSQAMTGNNANPQLALLDKAHSKQWINLYEVISWDMDKQEAKLKALFCEFKEDETRIVQNIKNISMYRFNLEAGDRVVCLKFGGDLNSSLEKVAVDTSFVDGIDNIGIIGIYSEDSYNFEISKTKIKLVGNLEVKGDLVVDGKIEASGDIKSSNGDIIAGSVSLKNHVHSANLTVSTTGNEASQTGTAVGKTDKAI